MGVKRFFIVLEPKQDVYYSGQAVVGSVHLHLDGALKCTGIMVKCMGKTKVQIVKQRGKQQVTYKEKEEYFSTVSTVWKPSDGNETLKTDSYKYPFSFVLPEGIPNSFEGRWGCVRYSLGAMAAVPGSFNKHSLKTYFTYNAPSDLNLVPGAEIPLRWSEDRSLGFIGCGTGPVEIEMVAPHASVALGQKFKPTITIRNNSSSEIVKSFITLNQYCVYHAKGKKTKDSRSVSKFRRGSVSGNSTEDYSDIEIDVPGMAPHLQNCGLIEMEYQIRVRVVFGWFRAMNFDCKLLVGNFPLNNAEGVGFQPLASQTQSFVGPTTLPCHMCIVKKTKRIKLPNKEHFTPNYAIGSPLTQPLT